MHIKAVVVDGRVAFTGSGNLTRASRCNREVAFKIVGPPVSQIMAAVRAAQQAAVTSRVP
jgi:phosphatidylserine/phosphatidylglycerophosphate/cardiolipin synthase-like enzyme